MVRLAIKLSIFFLFTVYVSGCSKDIYHKDKSFDDRNIFLAKNLIVPDIENYTYIYNIKQSNENYNQVKFKKLLLGSEYKSKDPSIGLDSSDTIFLKKANANSNLTLIRAVIDKNSFAIVQKNKSFIRRILHNQIDESLQPPYTKYLKIN